MKGFAINLTNPFDVYFFINLKKYVLNNYDINIVCFAPIAWKEADLQPYLDKISHNIVYISYPDCRYFNFNIVVNVIHIRRLIKQCRGLNEYILVTPDKSTLISNILLSNFKNKILLQYPFDDSDLYKRSKILTFYVNIYCHLFKLNKVFVDLHKEKEVEKLITLKTSIKDTFFIEKTSKGGSVVFPSNTIYNGNEIIIFGSRFIDWKFSTTKLVDEIIIIFKNIKKNYPNASYMYIPHPRESGEELKLLQDIFEKRLIVKNKIIPGELILQQVEKNMFCISIGSTLSRQAYLNGFRSYTFYKSLTLNRHIKDALDKIHSNLPKEYFLKNTLSIEMKYPKNNATDANFDDINNTIKGYVENNTSQVI